MLNQEQAQAELKKLENKEWVASRVTAADGLTEGLRDIARSILGAQEPRNHDAKAELANRKKILVKTFLTIKEGERVGFFETMAPGLGTAIERGWQLLDRLPYQSSYARKPFRAPGHPDVLITRRINWLLGLLRIIGPYQQNVAWFAAWASHITIYSGSDHLAILLAAAMDAGEAEGEDVFQILCASGRNEHPVGGMGRHVTRALLSASRTDGWQFVENMLLAAQRQEGLRQNILETVDESHPQAFRRMLKLILDENLSRFSSTVRAFDVWLGYQWDAVSTGVVNKTIEKILRYLEDPAARQAALNDNDSEQAYLSLWSGAFDNAAATGPVAAELLKHAKAEHRYVAAHLLGQLGLLSSQRHLLIPLEDPDLRVAACALGKFQQGSDSRVKKEDLFERLERLVARYPEKPEKLKPVIWPWTAREISKESVGDALLNNLGERPPTRLVPHLQHMAIGTRTNVIRLLGQQEKWDPATRDTLFAMVGDASRQVREAALRQLVNCQMTPEEAAPIEQLLDRKSGDLRRGALTLLARQPDEAVLASADRLLSVKSQPQRLAGLELLRQLVEANRCQNQARERARGYSAGHPKLNDAERQQVDVIQAQDVEAPKLVNGLGLFRHEDRTWPPAPVSREVQFRSAAGVKIVAALDELIKANAQQVVSFKYPNGDEWKGLLSDLHFRFPQPNPKKTAAEDRDRMPMADVLENWWRARGPELRDPDGMELLRALAWWAAPTKAFRGSVSNVAQAIFGDISEKNDYDWSIRSILYWLLRFDPPANAADFALDAAESAFALVPKESLSWTESDLSKLKQAANPRDLLIAHDWQQLQQQTQTVEAKASWRTDNSPFGIWLKVSSDVFNYAPQLLTPALHARRWQLLRWVDEPVRPAESGGEDGIGQNRCLPRDGADLSCLCLAYEAGAATDADVLDHLIGQRDVRGHGRRQFATLQKMSRRKPSQELSRFPFLGPLVEICRKRILEVELTRGDNPTAASAPALALKSIEGVANLVAVLRVLGKRNFVRGGYSYDSESMEAVLGHLARSCFPGATETANDFAREVKAANIGDARLVELAVYAPQWAAFVEHALGWDCLTEAVWWIHAHTKGTDWTVDREIRESWEADMTTRTSLSSTDLLEGAVDVAWFHRVYKALGARRWEMLYDAARFASTGIGHARAQLFADAMLGEVSKRELVQRITAKRYQDAVRALGLLPLAAGVKSEKDLLDRYKVIQEFRRGSKQFGSQRQASEKRAAQIGQQNLARTAGYADPIRLEWAMEAKAVEDLAEGPIEVAVDGVKVSLGIDPWGDVEFSISKDGQALADIPARLKKHPKITPLRERKVELKRQASRIRPSLEQFMVRGDEFNGAELRELMEHPLLSPMLANLIVVGDGVMGYPVHGGKAIENHQGEVDGVKAAEKFRIAHPHDFLPAAQWHRWQKDCFARERIQPFKQVFRELYPLTATEKEDGTHTRRYAGHQVQPRQALALLGQRGWVSHPEEGVRKVFHEAGLVAWLEFQEGFWTPAEIEGLTLENVFFTRRGELERLKLEKLSPRLFSETMRDLDLVVSVAHRGGVDPEASASTVEMRATLVQETTRLLKLTNVEVKDRYALIKGQLGEYSVHLGSAVTRKMPGEALFIVPVHSQHRGRLFLPFADDDPKTAEVMSKVLLLARDKEIKDPNILDQMR